MWLRGWLALPLGGGGGPVGGVARALMAGCRGGGGEREGCGARGHGCWWAGGGAVVAGYGLDHQRQQAERRPAEGSEGERWRKRTERRRLQGKKERATATRAFVGTIG